MTEPYCIDSDPYNADWTKRTWDLPPYKSKEFMLLLTSWKMTIDHFRRLPVYKFAIDQGLIANDEWIGK
jgi:hypothetical protein